MGGGGVGGCVIMLIYSKARYIIDHIYDIIENGNAIIDRTDKNVVYICAVIDHAGYIIYSSDEIMEFLSKIFNSHIDYYSYGSEQLSSHKSSFDKTTPMK